MASARPSPRLQKNGGSIVLGIPEYENVGSGALTDRGSSGAKKSVQDMSIAEMENQLPAKMSKRIAAESARGSGQPQTARALLEENKQLIQEKQKKKAIERQNSREEFEKLVVRDKLITESDRAQKISRRQAQAELSKHYKDKIWEKEQLKAEAYSKKVDSGVDIQYFPWVEGETIDKHRQEKSIQRREEVKEWMRKKREANPPRVDGLLADNKDHNIVLYPVGGLAGVVAPVPAAKDTNDLGSHIARHPRFLSRAQEHMSRRLHDDHVRRALEDKVMHTKVELEALAQQRERELQQLEEGIYVNDALRSDKIKSKLIERRQNKEFLEEQMKERQSRLRKEKEDECAEVAGYWGPEEKEVQHSDLHRDHCTHLIKQMEVDQRRKLISRQQRIKQEKRLVDNCLAEMTQDRARERQKLTQQKAVLVTTWHSQQKIKDSMRYIENF